MVNEYVERIKQLRDQYSDFYYEFEPGDDTDASVDAFNDESGAIIERCAATVSRAYRNGHYAHMWEAFAEAISDRGDDASDIIHDIKHETIHMLEWDRGPIHPDAFNNPTFERMVKEACGNYHYNPLSALLCQLTEYTDDETNLTRDNRLTIIEQVARVLLAINPHIHKEALSTLSHRLPYARHYYIDQYILGAPREAGTALASVGEQALRAETLPGHVIRYNRQFTPTPSVTRGNAGRGRMVARGNCARRTRKRQQGGRLSQGSRTRTQLSHSYTGNPSPALTSRSSSTRCS